MIENKMTFTEISRTRHAIDYKHHANINGLRSKKILPLNLIPLIPLPLFHDRYSDQLKNLDTSFSTRLNASQEGHTHS